MIEVNLKKKNKKIKFKLKILDNKYIDHIVEIKRIKFDIGDTLSIKWNVEISCFVDGKQTDKNNIKAKSFKVFKEIEEVRYLRFIKYKGKSKIFTYYDMPEDIYKI